MRKLYHNENMLLLHYNVFIFINCSNMSDRAIINARTKQEVLEFSKRIREVCALLPIIFNMYIEKIPKKSEKIK